MSDKPTFVVNDRRKFTAEGELRPDAALASTSHTEQENSTALQPAEVEGQPPVSEQELADLPESEALGALNASSEDLETPAPDASLYPEEADLPPGPTAEQAEEAARAYEATLDRLDTAMRAANPGGDRIPPMTFDRLVQSLYTQALILLGGGAQPGESPRVDLLGARDTIDMLAVLAGKAKGKLDEQEQRLIDSALFDLRMGFLEITQALARQAAQRGAAGTAGTPGSFGPMPGAGPRIVR